MANLDRLQLPFGPGNKQVMDQLPMKGDPLDINSMFKPAPPPAPLPPLPTRDDPAVLAAREKTRLAQLNRKGRGAANLTGGLGATDVSRPTARPSRLLGE